MDQVALEFGEGGEDAEYQASARRGGVDLGPLNSKHLESDAADLGKKESAVRVLHGPDVCVRAIEAKEAD